MSSNPSSPKVALLGRPNVGKSTLFNRLIRSNRAITHDRPGITRDRMEGFVRSRGHEEFILIDTGGVTLDSHSHVEQGPEGIRGFETAILEQAKDAVRESELLCLVVDGRDGLTPFDQHLAEFLRKQNKPLMLVVNKVDGPEKVDLLMADFHSLGLPILACSAAHGYNVRLLEEEIRERLFPSVPEEEETMEADSPMFFDGASRRMQKKLKVTYAELAKTAADAAAHAAALAEEADDDSEDETASASPAPTPEDELEQDTHEESESPLLEVLTPEELAALLEEELAEAERALTLSPEVVILDDDDEEGEEGEAPAEGEPVDPDMPDLYSGPLRLALLGRPNAGKSSIVNAMVGETRMIVSDVAGTTRDSVDVTTEIDGEPCTFVDTAGVRRRSKITDTVERYSVNSSIKSTTKAHVTLLVLDATEGLAQQDKRLIDLLNERKTPFMVLINKADLVDPKKRKEVELDYKEALVFCPHVPLIFVSAKNRHNLRKIVPLARSIRQECGTRIGTGQLNRSMTAVLDRHQPPMIRRVRAKFFYLTQAESSPPTFVFFVNDADRILPSYARYLERSLRKLFGIEHAPMRVHFRSSHKKKIRKR